LKEIFQLFSFGPPDTSLAESPMRSFYAAASFEEELSSFYAAPRPFALPT
jgi:hypothetical protein